MIPRTAVPILSRWWRSLDHGTLIALIGLSVIGIVLIAAASPPVAGRLGLDPFHFLYRHLLFFPVAMMVLIGASFLGPRRCFPLSAALLALSLLLLLLTLVHGATIKGASRWISLGGLSIQPVEFVKPAFAVVWAGILARLYHRPTMIGTMAAVGLFVTVIGMLAAQPDIGQAVLISSVALGELALICASPILIAGGVIGMSGLLCAYLLLPHVAARIDAFLHAGDVGPYQLSTSYKAFAAGGWFGTGPGNGSVKRSLPDAHSDFIFAVGAEEFGLLFCLLLLILVALIVLRSCRSISRLDDRGVILGAWGLLIVFIGQSAIHIASTMGLIPTKGMTLPFVSYGGSSMMGAALTMGLLLALTRDRFGGNIAPIGGRL